jgi:anti-sigma regulatory factor (Ser/Thr protein kinase)
MASPGTHDHNLLLDGAHVVHFYETDEGLVSTVGDYLVTAARAGDGLVLIATADHRRHFTDKLVRAGIDVTAAVAEGRIVLLDAAETIEAISLDGIVERSRFSALVATTLSGAAAAAGGRPVHAYGEMVALLWEAGNVNGAIALEKLWNDLARDESFSLFCAYPQHLFLDLATAERFADVCHTHSSVLGGATVPSDADTVRHFPTTLVAPRLARHFVIETLKQWGLDQSTFRPALIVSELATNAVLYGVNEFVVALSRRGDTVRVTVSDPEVALPAPRTAGPAERGGRGLLLVAALSDNWGFDRTADGKLVWAEMRLAAD